MVTCVCRVGVDERNKIHQFQKRIMRHLNGSSVTCEYIVDEPSEQNVVHHI